MAFSIHFHKQVIGDVDGIRVWYNDRMTGLGDEFTGLLEKTLATLKEDPTKYGTNHLDIAIVKIPKFPFAVGFLVDLHAIKIFGAFHLSMSDERWLSRLSSFE